jgi:hypothetical protein
MNFIFCVISIWHRRVPIASCRDSFMQNISTDFVEPQQKLSSIRVQKIRSEKNFSCRIIESAISLLSV